MNEEEETEITCVKEEEGENKDDDEKAITREMERVVVFPIMLTENLPPPII